MTDRKTEVKVRLGVALFSAALTLALGVVVWIMLSASVGGIVAAGFSDTLLGTLGTVMLASFAAQIIYAAKGQIFAFGGRLARREIFFAIICFQLIMQLSFGFSVYAVHQTHLRNNSFAGAHAHFLHLRERAGGDTFYAFTAIDLTEDMPPSIDDVFLRDTIAPYSPRNYYRFPLYGGNLLMRHSAAYFAAHLRNFAVSLIMSLVISILLMAELVHLAVKIINNRIERTLALHQPNAALPVARPAPGIHPVEYLRQITFLFYFAGFLGASFIPIMARDFVAGAPAADFIAGLPYSVEALFNCVAILLTPKIFRTRGWKPLYVAGVFLFVGGLVSSALSPNAFIFIASRALVGIGYGFCWMTLRNVAALDGDATARTTHFANLSAGIYAGIMCGVAFGAVLSDIIPFRFVLFISAVLVLVSSVFILFVKNIKPPPTPAGVYTKNTAAIRPGARDILLFSIFLIAIVIPVSITDAFSGFLLPLYVDSIGAPMGHVGRVALIYNLCLVYISSGVLLRLVQRYVKSPWASGTIHVLIACAALAVLAYMGGFMAVLIAGMLLGLGDGFGFSIQNAFLLDTNVAKKLGIARTLTLFSLFKKIIAIFAPVILGLALTNGFTALGWLAVFFAVLAGAGVFAAVVLLSQPKAEA